MQKQWIEIDTVRKRLGTIKSNNIAAFDFDNTLAWSDSGLIYMRTENDWASVTSSDNLIRIITNLISDQWTIVIFANQLEHTKEFTRKSIDRINNFIAEVDSSIDFDIKNRDESFDPFVYMATQNDFRRKPNVGMWSMFYADTRLKASPASFYCGDAKGEISDNPLYKWADHDLLFALNCGLTFYTPDEIFGVYNNISVDRGFPGHRLLLVMAAHESQYKDFVDDMRNFGYQTSSLQNAPNILAQGGKVIVLGEKFATHDGRARAKKIIPAEYHNDIIFVMFTRPIKPFITDRQYAAADNQIRGYANALDVHPHLSSSITFGDPYTLFTIVRIN